VKTVVNTIELHADLVQYPVLQPLADKSAVLRSCTLQGTLPSGLTVNYAFKTVSVSEVNAVAHERRDTTKDPIEHAKLVGTFTGLDIQSTGGGGGPR
jgi:hypothetical protein